MNPRPAESAYSPKKASLRGDRAQVFRHLQGLEFERGLFGGGFFLGLEVAADAEAIEAAIDPPRDHAIAVFEPIDGDCRLIHV